jgi:MSHA biogenesis protein MshI
VFSFKKRKKTHDSLLALQVMPDGVALAVNHLRDGAPHLETVAFIEQAQPLTNSKVIAEYLSEHRLTDVPVSLVLQEGEYQLLLIEAPDVPVDELKDALLWRVKDLIQFNPEDAYLDYIELPDDAYRGRGKMIYVVVAERTLIDQRVDWLDALGVSAVAIDIPELALLNITESLCAEEMGTAVLFLEEDRSNLTMLSGSALYLARGLSYSPFNQVENTVLDIQRSMDYFESQIGKPPCVRILILPLQVGETPLLIELRNNLSADVQSLDLADVVGSDEPLRVDLQQVCLIAIAASLRHTEAK